MRLKAFINGSTYDVVQGATFSEEYNETLDSGTIILDNVSKISDLRPYDDAIVYDADEVYYDGQNIPGKTDGEKITITYSSPNDYYERKASASNCYKYLVKAHVANAMKSEGKGYILYTGGKTSTVSYNRAKDQLSFGVNGTTVYFSKETSGDYTIEYPYGTPTIIATYKISAMMVTVTYSGVSGQSGFYKHMLVDQFAEKLVNISQRKYKYAISLFSETKRLETIQLPNISITQPASIADKKTVYWYLSMYVNEYSPKVKVSLLRDGTWDYFPKLALDPQLESVFSNVYAPDFSLTNPTLKDVISQLMLTRDRIPYVKDGVIHALDISERNGTFDFSEGDITNVVGSMSSSNFADNLRRPYQNALSDRNSCRLIEYCGFRNSGSALLTIPNMRVETRYPIYRVNKVLLCYYKKGKVFNSDGSLAGYKYFLCKQDITKLCMIDAARSVLSQNWKEFEALPKGSDGAIDIDDLAKYQMSTFQYSIGGNALTGWGDIYEHNKDFTGWFKTTSTVIENIATQLDIANPYGIYAAGYIANLGDGQIFSAQGTDLSNMVSAFSDDNASQKMKGFFFQVDYEAFYNGAVSISKDGGRDDVTAIDNSSSSLAVLEKDGVFQKEKANRFGNKALQINALYEDISGLQPLGSVYDGDGEEDVVIYHREYSIFANAIQTAYYGSKDYVLKNYWTSVYSQNRPFSLLPYEQSVSRAESERVCVLLSKDELYWEGTDGLSFSNFDNGFIADAISAFRPSEKATSKGVFETPHRIDAAFIEYDGDYYQSDANCFVAGYSLCLNARMFDNASMGVYVSEREPDYWVSSAELQYIGSTQRWYKTVDESGRMSGAEVLFGKFNAKKYYLDAVSETMAESEIKTSCDAGYARIFAQPMLSALSMFTPKIKSSFGNPVKDNKETMDYTFQIEPLAGAGVSFSPWLMKLSDLVTVHNKVDETYDVFDVDSAGKGATFTYASLNYYYSTTSGAVWGHYPAIMFSMEKEAFAAMKKSIGEDGIAINNAPTMIWNSNEDGGNGGYGDYLLYDRVGYYSFTPIKIVSIGDDSMTVRGIETFRYKDAFWIWGSSEASQETDIVLQMADASTPVGHVTFDYDSDVVFSDTFPSLEDASASHPMPLVNSVKRMPVIRSRSFTTQFNIQVDPSLIGGSTGTQELSTLNNSSVTLVSLSGGTMTTYEKNMFVQFSDEIMSKEAVYDEYASKPDGIDDSILASDTFRCEVDRYKRPYIQVTLPSGSVAKSARLWYYNQESSSYVFVLGVNLTDDEIAAGGCKIYASVLQTKDERVYDNRMRPLGTMRNCAQGRYMEQFGTTKEYTE